MKKQNQILEVLPESTWEDNQVVRWLFDYGRQLLFGLLGLLVILLIAYIFTSTSKKSAENDYVNSMNEFQLFARNPTNEDDALVSKDALAKLQIILDRHPELHAKFDGPIAQVLIDRGETQLALNSANLAIGRTKEENYPFYTEYSQTTLLIGEQKYQEALDRSQSLLNQMNSLPKTESPAFGDTLLAYNLLRIGMLQQKLEMKQDELKTWREWQKLSKTSKTFAQQIKHFEEGDLTLSNYIEMRIQQLK
jgi:hypothetical protein